MTCNQALIQAYWKVRNHENLIREDRAYIRNNLRKAIRLERERRANPRSRYHALP